MPSLHFALPVAPHILPFTFREDVEAGQLVQVSCAVIEGDGPVSLQWYKDGMLLVSSSEYTINNVDMQLSLLLLRKVNDQHRGTYTCMAMNPVGRSEFSARLNVKGINILHLNVCMLSAYREPALIACCKSFMHDSVFLLSFL